MSIFTAFQQIPYPIDNNIYSSIINNVIPTVSSAAVNVSECNQIGETETVSKNKRLNTDSIDQQTLAKRKKFVDPFDPEATVPLPFQLEDQYGPYSSSVWKRNERERCRVRCVNKGYDDLRHHLPLRDGEKRISKVDTLRLAIRYIRHLDLLLKNTLHQYSCNCFNGFQEESEGNIQVDFQSFLHHPYQ